MWRAAAHRRHAGRAQYWPGIATPALSARTAGACFLLGGALVLVLAVLAPADFTELEVVFLSGALAVLVGVGVLWWGDRLQPWQFSALVITSIALTTTTVHMAATPAAAVSLATLYGFVAIAAFFLPWRWAAIHLGLAVVCCLAVLDATGFVPWWPSMIASVTVTAMGTVIAVLGFLVGRGELDATTGLPNRRGFDRIVGHEIACAQAGGPAPVLVVICIDGVGTVGDKLGSHAGEQLVRNTVEAWRTQLEPGQILARIGGSEFAVLLPGATEQAGVALTHLLRAVMSTECSAGVTGWLPGESLSMVLHRVDAALRRARRGGSNRTVLESPGLPTLAAELADALANDAVDVLYQPIVSLTAPYQVTGVEALVRWTSPTRPELSIPEIIAAAENSNLIARLDRFVLRRACTDVQWIQQRGGAPLTLAVNVSGLELIEKDYPATVSEILEVTGWPADQLVLEITESVVEVDTPASEAALRELREHGIKVAIDDFGTGYSTLSRLHTLPIDILKLDASFTARTALDASSTPPPLLQAIAALARALNLPVVIEGVETEAQATMLQDSGFAMAQGYFFGRPQQRQHLVDRLTVG